MAIFGDDCFISPNSTPAATGFSVSDANCVLAYEFEDNVTDLSGNGNNGTLSGDAAYIIGGVNAKCLTLDGVGDNVNVAYDASLDITTNITISAWIKRDVTLNTENGILSKTVYNVILNNSGQLRFEIETGGYHNNLTTGTVASETWTHICCTYDGSNIRTYINGSEDSNSPTANTGSISTNASGVLVGLHAGGYFPGEIDRLFLFNVTKSAADIADEYNAYAP